MFGLGRKPVAKRVTRTLKRIKEELYRRINHDVYEVAAWLGRVVNGWLQLLRRSYQRSIPQYRFMRRLQRLWLKVLRRRSQKDRFPWERAGTCHDTVLAIDQNSTPLAECALCRQTLKVGAVCINVPARI